MTVILAFSVFMLAIAERMPETSESIPLIGNGILCVVLARYLTTVEINIKQKRETANFLC